MAVYKCFSCKKEIEDSMIRKKVRCPFCGYKIIIKPRSITTKVKAR